MVSGWLALHFKTIFYTHLLGKTLCPRTFHHFYPPALFPFFPGIAVRLVIRPIEFQGLQADYLETGSALSADEPLTIVEPGIQVDTIPALQTECHGHIHVSFTLTPGYSNAVPPTV
jgi:hypothetical protein